jgi:hypothetical protein
MLRTPLESLLNVEVSLLFTPFCRWAGTAEGTVRFEVVSPPGPGERTPRRSTVTLTLRAPIVETPPRSKRVLWDNYHSVRYQTQYNSYTN